MCSTDFEKELTAQQHLVADYAQMKACIVTVINSLTRGLAPMMMGNLSDEAAAGEYGRGDGPSSGRRGVPSLRIDKSFILKWRKLSVGGWLF